MSTTVEGGFAGPAEPPGDRGLWPGGGEGSGGSPTRQLPGATVAPDAETADAAPVRHAAGPGGPRRMWFAFRQWRRSRPFWGALFSFIGGAEILLTELAPLRVVIHIGALGLIGFAVPVLVMLCALMLWFAPHPRLFYASLILLLSLASWITSNLGGFFLGMVLGLVGGALALTWTTAPKRRTPEEDTAQVL